MKEAMQITKWVALACSSGPDNSLQYSNCFVLDANKRRTLKHTSGVLDDQKCFDGHGFSKKFMCSIYSSTAKNIVMGYLIIFNILVTIEKGLHRVVKMNPDITPDRCPKKDACGTKSCMITSSAHGASLRDIEKKPKSSVNI